jgi:phenylacetate-CoA ligase
MSFHAATQLLFLARHLIRRNPWARARARHLVERERLPLAALQARQADLLRLTLAAARRRLPRYAGLPAAPAEADIHAWLRQHYPVIGKPDLLAGRASLYPNGGVRRPWWPLGMTSGTSGTPLEVFRSVASVVWEEAFHLQFWSWAGYRNGQAQAVLRGDAFIPLEQQRPPYWRWDRYGRQLFVSTRHLTQATAGAMLDAIGRAGAGMLRAYPSSAYHLARLAQQAQHPLRLRAIVTGSEPCYGPQREQIEHSFGCKIFDFYGMAERIAFAGQCEHGHYHLHPEYAYVEILDEHDQPTTDFGYVVGTTLHNHVMPLLRYRVADRARWVPGDCPCGRHYPRIELSAGKVEDQLFDREGTPVSASIITFALKSLSHIKQTQVAQVGPGLWELRVVPDTGYTDADGATLCAHFATYVSRKVEARLRLMEHIALQPSGKFKWVAQEWDGARALGQP